MNTIFSLIRSKVEIWIELEKDNNQSIIKSLLSHIEQKGNLRPPQREAIETYLWIKFVGGNKKLSDMVREGLLYDDQIAGLSRTLSPHKMRHFLLTWLKKQGIDDAFIQPYSGHASRQSLEVYSKLSIKDAQKEYNKVIDDFPI